MNERNKNILFLIIILGIYIALYFIPTPISPLKMFAKGDDKTGCALICFLAASTIVMQSWMSDHKLIKILNYIVGSITIISLFCITFFYVTVDSYQFNICLGILILSIFMYIGLFYLHWRRIKKEKEEQEEIDRKWGK